MKVAHAAIIKLDQIVYIVPIIYTLVNIKS